MSRLRSGKKAGAALRTAVLAYMSHQIDVGAMDGPIRSSSCQSVGAGGGTRLVFHCRVIASAQMVAYPFDGVVETRSGVVTFCQRVAPPVPSMNVPVSPRCR